MIDYDYLDWGVGIPMEDDFKTVEYTEQEEGATFETDEESVIYEEPGPQGSLDVLYLRIPEEDWDEESDSEKWTHLARQVAAHASSIVPGHALWKRGESHFLDAFLLEPMEDLERTAFDSVLLLTAEDRIGGPLAVIWEMVPPEKRHLLMNLQRSGRKIYGVLSETFANTGLGTLCLEIYIKE